MGEKTAIAWTDHTFNLAWGCYKVSPGCKNCYADTFSTQRLGQGFWGKNAPRRTFGPNHWNELNKYQRTAERDGAIIYPHNPYIRLVFCCSMCDVFEGHPTIDGELPKLWDAVRRNPNLHFQLLTKRPENIEARLPKGYPNGYENVWLGTSIEHNDYRHRADYIRDLPAAVRFISYEPALGPLDQVDLTGIDWVIYGGESGPGYRNHDISWPRQMRAMCKENDVAFFFKQSPAPRTEMGIELDGEIVREFPRLRIQRPSTGICMSQSPLFENEFGGMN